MSKPLGASDRGASAESVQPIISHNVRILMAYKAAQQQTIGFVIGKTAGAVGHKLAGRADWTPDEIKQLSNYGGKQWPISRFFTNPESAPVDQTTLPKVAAYVVASNPESDKTARKTGHLRAVK